MEPQKKKMKIIVLTFFEKLAWKGYHLDAKFKKSALVVEPAISKSWTILFFKKWLS